MMELRLGHTRISAHPFLLLLPLLGLHLGLRTELTATMVALAVHEGAHLLAAQLAGVRVEKLRLMPFGGAILPGNIYALSPGQLLAVAAAGPTGNLAALTLAAALAHWGVLLPGEALLHLRVNLALMLFNLLPGLPLDGGRMLYALTSRRLGRARAATLGIILGRVAAAGLLLLVLRGIAESGHWNVSLNACAIFIIASAQEERRALADLSATSPLNALRAIGEPIDLKICAVDEGCAVLRALRKTSPEAATLYAVYRDSRLAAFTDERALLELALADRKAAVGMAI